MSQLTNEERNAVLEMINSGYQQRELSRLFKVSQATTSRLLKKNVKLALLVA